MRPIILLAALLLAACDKSPPKSLAGAGMDPVAFFTGHVHSWGVTESRSAAPTDTVETDCQGAIDPQGRLRMTQHLTFGDGTAQDRIWTMWRTGQDTYQATANDMQGIAEGRTDGRLFHWQWQLSRPTVNVTMEQWMYRLPDGTVLIRTTVSKLGVVLMQASEQFARL
jgi:hypothetical protein